jgi:hypothetical protein
VASVGGYQVEPAVRLSAAYPPKIVEWFDIDVTRLVSGPSFFPVEPWKLKANDCSAIDDDDHQISGIVRGVCDDMEDGSTGENAINDLQQIPILRSGIAGLYSGETNMCYIISVVEALHHMSFSASSRLRYYHHS